MRDVDRFRHTILPHLDRRVLRLGLAANFGLAPADIAYAADRGVNMWLWVRTFREATAPLRELLEREREAHVVAVLAGVAYTARGARRAVARARQNLGVDQLDLFLLPWLGRASRFSPRIQEALVEMREAGLVRAVGTSIHDRKRAGALARESILDAFMVRFNAKHPGAELDIFPHLAVRNPLVISYTATSWRQLLRPLKGIEMPPWPGEAQMREVPPLTAALCYRFVLSSPHVHVAWTGPANRAQLDENLAALEAGPLSAEEEAWVREYGRRVKARRRLDYV